MLTFQRVDAMVQILFLLSCLYWYLWKEWKRCLWNLYCEILETDFIFIFFHVEGHIYFVSLLFGTPENVLLRPSCKREKRECQWNGVIPFVPYVILQCQIPSVITFCQPTMLQEPFPLSAPFSLAPVQIIDKYGNGMHFWHYLDQ